MKYTTLIISLLFMCNLSAQDYRFNVELAEDSTFTLQVIEDLSDTRAKIEQYAGLDSAALQNRLYADINAAYERIARLEREIDDNNRQRSQLLFALRSVDLDNYALDTRARLDSFYVAPRWTYASSAGAREELTTLYREGNTTIMRDAENTNVATIIPLSPNNIIYRFLPIGTNDVEMFSNNSQTYTGVDSAGVRHVLIRRRQ
jgi:hypothetical protein